MLQETIPGPLLFYLGALAKWSHQPQGWHITCPPAAEFRSPILIASELRAYIVHSLPDTSNVSDLIHIKQRLDSSHPNPFFTNFPILVTHTVVTQPAQAKITSDASLSLTPHLHSVADLTASTFKIQPKHFISSYLYCCHRSLSSRPLSSGSHQIHP